MMPVSEIAVRKGCAPWGERNRRRSFIWETLMDAETLVLTANTETVYGMGLSI